jgi:hypothetical protein
MLFFSISRCHLQFQSVVAAEFSEEQISFGNILDGPPDERGDFPALAPKASVTAHLSTMPFCLG